MLMKVMTDHKSLKYLITTKKLTSKQTKGAVFLLEYNFIINYQSSKKNNKIDALTCKLNKRPIDNKNERLEHRI